MATSGQEKASTLARRQEQTVCWVRSLLATRTTDVRFAQMGRFNGEPEQRHPTFICFALVSEFSKRTLGSLLQATSNHSWAAPVRQVSTSPTWHLTDSLLQSGSRLIHQVGV